MFLLYGVRKIEPDELKDARKKLILRMKSFRKYNSKINQTALEGTKKRISLFLNKSSKRCLQKKVNVAKTNT